MNLPGFGLRCYPPDWTILYYLFYLSCLFFFFFFGLSIYLISVRFIIYQVVVKDSVSNSSSLCGHYLSTLKRREKLFMLCFLAVGE
jgi:hypothetical protein